MELTSEQILHVLKTPVEPEHRLHALINIKDICSYIKTEGKISNIIGWVL